MNKINMFASLKKKKMFGNIFFSQAVEYLLVYSFSKKPY